MKFEVQVLSREAIKPSSPTPSHLRHYQLSFLDQISPPSFIPLVFFYPKQTNDKLSQTEKSNQLKNHLSQVLTRFYPLAGRVRESTDNLYVDCNDDGVPYVEAAITDCKLSEFISDTIPEELNKLQPCQLDDVTDGLPMAIQVNFFDCGGIAIFVAISHKLADGLSVIVFVNSWASIARGDDNVPPPHLDAASLFPPKKLDGFMPSSGIIKDRIITKRFLFTASKIAALRDKCSDDTSHTTRIEALSTFLWSRFMASIVEKRDPKTIYAIFYAVNLRTRADPPLPQHYFGNFFRGVIAEPNMEKGGDWFRIVKQVREAIRKVDGDYVRMLRGEDNYLKFLKENAKNFKTGEVVSFNFSSLCRFPLYEADFGWGKPEWVALASMPFKNVVMFMETQSGDGIEAWVNLKDEDMAKFQVDKELLAFVEG